MVDNYIELEVKGNGPYIKAPDICPYAEDGEIHTAICAVCKFCKFTSKIKDSEQLTISIPSEQLQNYFTNTNKYLARSILGQDLYLKKLGRKPLLVLINHTVFRKALLEVLNQESAVVDIIFDKVLQYNLTICKILGCPVIVSKELTRTAIQLVGEISWK